VAVIAPAGVVIVLEVAAIAVEVTAAGIGAEAAGAIADRPDRDRSRRKAFLIVARQAAGL
jgi:hypothetical protein